MDKGIIAYHLFKDFHQIKAFTSTRLTLPGVTNPRFTGNPEKVTEESRIKLAEALSIDALQLVFPRQTHTRSVARLSTTPKKELQDTDALITNKPGICLCVQTADCVPLFIFDPVNNIIAAVHAGWRGTVGLIVKEVVQQFKDHFSSSTENIRAVIGPSIGPDVYEVGNEVVDAVMKSIPNPYKSLTRFSSGKYHFNLWEANRQVLLESGMLNENIEISGYCTYSDKEHFFSARREGIKTGRLVSGIMLLNG